MEISSFDRNVFSVFTWCCMSFFVVLMRSQLMSSALMFDITSALTIMFIDKTKVKHNGCQSDQAPENLKASAYSSSQHFSPQQYSTSCSISIVVLSLLHNCVTNLRLLHLNLPRIQKSPEIHKATNSNTKSLSLVLYIDLQVCKIQPIFFPSYTTCSHFLTPVVLLIGCSHTLISIWGV